MLNALGYIQPPTHIYADNMAAVGIANDTVKLRRSKAIDMRYHWIRDRVRQGIFKVLWSQGPGNIADYFTKLQPTKRQLIFESIFTKTQELVRGCVDTVSHYNLFMHNIIYTYNVHVLLMNIRYKV